VCDIVVKRLTFVISSPDEFLFFLIINSHCISYGHIVIMHSRCDFWLEIFYCTDSLDCIGPLCVHTCVGPLIRKSAYGEVSRKRRKSRTAFTNQQLSELERRFVRQKYISPADRDHIARTVGMTSAQVSTAYVSKCHTRRIWRWHCRLRRVLSQDLDLDLGPPVPIGTWATIR